MGKEQSGSMDAVTPIEKNKNKGSLFKNGIITFLLTTVIRQRSSLFTLHMVVPCGGEKSIMTASFL